MREIESDFVGHPRIGTRAFSRTRIRSSSIGLPILMLDSVLGHTIVLVNIKLGRSFVLYSRKFADKSLSWNLLTRFQKSKRSRLTRGRLVTNLPRSGLLKKCEQKSAALKFRHPAATNRNSIDVLIALQSFQISKRKHFVFRLGCEIFHIQQARLFRKCELNFLVNYQRKTVTKNM